MSEYYFQTNTNLVEDGAIVLSLSLAVTYLVFTVVEYYKPRMLVDLGQARYLV